MNYQDFAAMVPVNGRAARVVSQKGCTGDTPLSKDELLELVARLQRKSRLLKLVLNIKNKAQHKNLIWKSNKGFKTQRATAEPRALVEYRRVGVEIQRMLNEVKNINDEAKRKRLEARAEQLIYQP